jgi:hypothetical protein
MTSPPRLSDRDLFAARPWRAANRNQVIVAVVDAGAGAWQVVVATLQGTTVFTKPLEARRSVASFTEGEMQALYDEAHAAVA